MDEKLVLTAEQLFFLGTLMDAEHIDYDYIAAMHEIGRNYQRVQRSCMSELAQMGIVRQRLSGETTLRPIPEKLLKNIFFGKTETILEVCVLGEQPERHAYRFHWLDGSVVQVQMEGKHLHLAESSREAIDALLTQYITTNAQPRSADRIRKEAVTRILMAKRMEYGAQGAGAMLFEQDGGLYTVDDAAIPTGVTGQQACEMLLAVLKGE